MWPQRNDFVTTDYCPCITLTHIRLRIILAITVIQYMKKIQRSYAVTVTWISLTLIMKLSHRKAD